MYPQPSSILSKDLEVVMILSFLFSNPIHQRVMANFSQFHPLLSMSFAPTTSAGRLPSCLGDEGNRLLTSFLRPFSAFSTPQQMTVKHRQTASLPDDNRWCLSIALGVKFKLFTLSTHMSPVQCDPWTLLQMQLMSFLPHLLPCSHINLCAGSEVCWSAFPTWGVPL